MKKKLTKEEKELLIKDLLPRIPTDLLVKVPGEKEPKELRKRVRWMIVYGKAKSIEDCLEGLIPYLRPESSMTKKDEEDYYKYNEDCNLAKAHDWYCTHHFDIRGFNSIGFSNRGTKGNVCLKKNIFYRKRLLLYSFRIKIDSSGSSLLD